jgi:UDP-N-acetylmuramyl-tripeptide synthetase
MLLSEALAHIPGIELSGSPHSQIRGVAYDSRRVEPEHLFVAIRGEKSDGGRFVAQALERGAAAVASEQPLDLGPETATIRVDDARRFLALVSRNFYRNPASELRLAAVTGTNGKTTTTYLLNHIFAQQQLRSCLVGTIGMKIGEESFPSAHTTPESSDLLAFFRQALRTGCTHGVIEASSHALHLKRVFGVKFTVGVFTNLTPEHLDFHKDMESYYAAKRLLFVPEGENRIDAAVVNVDDEYGRRLARETRAGEVITYGFDPMANIRCTRCETQMSGSKLVVQTRLGAVEINTRLVGRPNVYNIMGAVGAALSLGFDLKTIRRGLESVQQIPGRMESIVAGQRFTVIVDYAHTPDALQKLLETVAQVGRRRIITVFGCGGDRDRQKRPAMGKVAAELSDYVVATSDNPRTEDPMSILTEVEAGLREGRAPFVVIPDRREGIAQAICMAGPEDVVVIAGKGHETYQIVGTRVFAFDDRAVAREAIAQLPLSTGSRPM